MKHVHVVDHPFLQQRLAELRNKNTSTAQFRRAVIECGEILSVEITRDLPTSSIEVETPLEPTTAKIMSYPITVIAILRAALGLVEGLSKFLPNTRIGHIGIYRNEETLKPVNYYCNMPSDLASGFIILADPMLATGGSLIASLDVLAGKTPLENLRVATILAAPEGIAAVHEKYPEIPIFTMSVDRGLNDVGYILPGLGDAGDRQYGTG